MICEIKRHSCFPAAVNFAGITATAIKKTGQTITVDGGFTLSCT